MREKDAKKKRDEGVDSERGVKSANSLSINVRFLLNVPPIYIFIDK